MSNDPVSYVRPGAVQPSGNLLASLAAPVGLVGLLAVVVTIATRQANALLLTVIAALALGGMAVVLGAIGMARGQIRGGRGRAMAGIVVGALSLLGGMMCLGAYFQGKTIVAARPAIASTRQFVMMIGSGQVGPAKGMCTDAIDEIVLTDAVEKMQEWGGLRGDIGTSDYGKLNDPQHDIEVHARLPFEKTTKTLITHWAMIDGTPRLTAFKFVDAPPDPATQPATKK